MGEIRSPCFSLGQYYFEDTYDIHSPYFSYVRGYHGDNAEIHPPCSSFGDYHGDNAETHPPYCSAGDYHGDNAEIYPPCSSFGDCHGDNAATHPPYCSVGDCHGDNADISGNPCIPKHCEEPENPYTSPRRTKKRKQEGCVCIYRVPRARGESNDDIYSPQLISIGPIHHGNENLDFMEKKKDDYYDQFWGGRVSKEADPDTIERKFWCTVGKKENEIRNHYEDDSHKNECQAKFQQMIVYDAVFIFELFLRYAEADPDERDFMREDWLSWESRRDLMLLENQLPFFILEELYGLLPDNIKGGYLDFIDLACMYFKRLFTSEFHGEAKPVHFTDMVRSLLSFSQNKDREQFSVYCSQNKEREQFSVCCSKRKDRLQPIKSSYSATKLRQAGVKFKVLQQYDYLLDADFSKLTTEFCIPQLKIDDNTERLFKNLMAFEKRHYPKKEYICDYIHLLGTLVAETKDAKLLMEKGIVIDAEAVAAKVLIHNLAVGTNDQCSSYRATLESLKEYNQEWWPRNRAYLMEHYFGNIWKVLGTFSSILLLILAFIQAICAILSLRASTSSGCNPNPV